MKAFIGDILFAGLIIAPIIIFFFAIVTAFNQIQTLLLNIPGGGPGSVSAKDLSFFQGLLYNFDYLIPFIYYGFCIGIIILAGFLNSNPVNYAIGLFILVFLIFTSFIISNNFTSILKSTPLAATAAKLPLSLQLIADLPIPTAIFGLVYLVVIVTKLRYGNLLSEE